MTSEGRRGAAGGDGPGRRVWASTRRGGAGWPSWSPRRRATCPSTPRRARSILQGLDCGGSRWDWNPGPGPRAGHGDVGRCLADGYSTAGSPGNGPGGDGPPSSDASTSTPSPEPGPSCWPALGKTRDGRVDAERAGARGRERPASPGEEVCGDAWAIEEATGRTWSSWSTGWGTARRPPSGPRGRSRASMSRRCWAPTEIVRAAHDALQRHPRCRAGGRRLDPNRQRGAVRRGR